MGAGYVLLCDNCGREIETDWMWEYYRDSRGRPKRYGHPRPMSLEAKEAGIAGYMTTAYCHKCDRVRTVIEEDPERDGIDDSQLACGRCGESLYDNPAGLSGEIPYPLCAQGPLVLILFRPVLKYALILRGSTAVKPILERSNFFCGVHDSLVLAVSDMSCNQRLNKVHDSPGRC
ncbi:hypothetical protein ACFLST_01320 [Chloroflexota bacterium]